MKNLMTTTDLGSIKSKYIVSVQIFYLDKKGNRKNKLTNYIFTEDTILENRRNAILKAQKIENNFNNSRNQTFASFFEAEEKGFKNFKGYCINVNLHIEENEVEIGCSIYGDKEITYDALEYEAFFFKKMFEITKFTKVENNEDKTIEVIEENLCFLLS